MARRKRSEPRHSSGPNRTGPTSGSAVTAAAGGSAIPPGRSWLLAVRGLALGLLAVSLYLLGLSVVGGGAWGCGVDSGCGTVLTSRWSRWMGVPVSLGAVMVYLAVLGASWRLGAARPEVTRRRVWTLLLGAGCLILGSALWFIGIQAWVIQAFCPYCMAAHAGGIVLAVLLLRRAIPMVGAVAGRRIGGLVAGLLAVLVAGQVLYQPRRYTVQPMALGVVVSNQVAEVPPSARATNGVIEPLRSTPAVTRKLSLHDGLFELDLGEVPLRGSPDAPRVMVNLFDYTCRHCRALHAHLVAAQERFSNQLAVVNLPVPLEGSCNPLVKRALPDHSNACVYARLSLAMWRADRARFAEFDAWLFTGERPAPPDLARARAEQALGTERLGRALDDPWVEAQLRFDTRLHGTNYHRFRKGSLPQLMIGTNLIAGEVRGPDLARLLSTAAGLPGTVR